MSKEKEVRQQAFKRWVEYENKADALGDKVVKLEITMHEVYEGIEVNTEIYQSLEMFGRLWYDWYDEYFGEIINHAKSLGFDNGRYPSTLLDFDDAKCETGLYEDYWIQEAINVDRFFINTRSSSGTFHRFMMLEEALVKFGVIDKLDENGYLELTALIDKCINYLDNVVSDKLLKYVELLKYMEEKRNGARRSCDKYIHSKMKENRQDSFYDRR